MNVDKDKLVKLEQERDSLAGAVQAAKVAGDIGALRHLRERRAAIEDEVSVVSIAVAREDLAAAAERVKALEATLGDFDNHLADSVKNLERVGAAFTQAQRERDSAVSEQRNARIRLEASQRELANAQRKLSQLISPQDAKPMQVPVGHREVSGSMAIDPSGHWTPSTSGPRPLNE